MKHDNADILCSTVMSRRQHSTLSSHFWVY